MSFDAEETLPLEQFEQITEIRIDGARVIDREARQRKRRRQLTRDGKLVLLALDHPGRGITKIRNDDLAMGDRHQMLARTLRLMEDVNLDGVVATADMLEELLILSHCQRLAKGRSFLDRRVLVGSMNRGGLEGTAFEMDDTFTSISGRRLRELRAEGGKLMYRLDPGDPASGRTIAACARALNELRQERLTAFLEPLGVARRGDGYEALRNTATLVRQCGIASALGESSAHLWLKLPYCENFDRVCRATTLPILLLGGPARETPAETLEDFAEGLKAGTRVRGAIIGRNLLFPNSGDPLPMCRALTALVHRGAGYDAALRYLEEPSEVSAHAG